jgi:hypothetical protein
MVQLWPERMPLASNYKHEGHEDREGHESAFFEKSVLVPFATFVFFVVGFSRVTKVANYTPASCLFRSWWYISSVLLAMVIRSSR